MFEEFPLSLYKKWEFKWKLKWEVYSGILDKYDLGVYLCALMFHAIYYVINVLAKGLDFWDPIILLFHLKNR